MCMRVGAVVAVGKATSAHVGVGKCVYAFKTSRAPNLNLGMQHVLVKIM